MKKTIATLDATTIASRLEQRLQAEIDRIERALPAGSVLKFTGMSRTDDDLPAAQIDESDRVTLLVGNTAAQRDYFRVYMIGFGKAPSGVRPMTVGDACAFVRLQAADMASDEATRLAAALALVPTKLRAAVTERAVERWQWATMMGGVLQGFDLLRALRWMAQASTMANPTDLRALTEASEPWPTDISLRDAVEWLRDRLEEQTRGAGKRFEEASHRYDAAYGPRPYGAGLNYGKGSVLVQGHHLAWLYSAFTAVERDSRHPAFKVPATSAMQTAIAMLATLPNEKNTDRWGAATPEITGAFSIVWNGKAGPKQFQLALTPGDGSAAIEQATAAAIVAELGEDGFRDWITLYKMASEQGSDGRFRWTWEAHKRHTIYETRAKNDASDHELAKAARARLWKLGNAEIWVEETRGDKTARARLGPFGLINIGAELLHTADGAPIIVDGSINPALYDGARHGRKQHFALYPESLLMLPSHELPLAAQILMQFRNDADKGVTRLTAKRLWEWANISEQQRTSRKRWPQCRASLERWLDDLRRTQGIEWSGGGSEPTDVYELRAPGWLHDRMVHKVAPKLAAGSTASVPRTGPELDEAMTVRKLTNQTVADVLGVNRATVMRNRKKPDPLPVEWLPKLAAAKLYRG